MPITIRVLLFAAAREAAGNLSSVDIELEEGAANTGVLRCVGLVGGEGNAFFIHCIIVWVATSTSTVQQQ
jgi:hypothetical protein